MSKLRLCLVIWHSYISLAHAYLRVLLNNVQHTSAPVENCLYMTQQTHRTSLQPVCSRSSTFVCSQFAGPRDWACGRAASVRELFVLRKRYGKSAAHRETKPLLSRDCRCGKTALRNSRTAAANRHRARSRSAGIGAAVFHRRWRHCGLIVLRMPSRAWEQTSLLFLADRDVQPPQDWAQPFVKAPCYIGCGSLFSLTSAATASCQSGEPTGEGGYWPSSGGCIVQFVIHGDCNRSCEGKEVMQTSAQSVSPLTGPIPPTPQSRATAYLRFASTVGFHRSSTNTSTCLGRYPLDTAEFCTSPDARRNAAALFVRKVTVSPHAPDNRLDVFLTKHLRVSRTLVAAHIIKGRNVWIDGTLCVTPSRRVRPGHCVTCRLASTGEPKVRSSSHPPTPANAGHGNCTGGHTKLSSQSLIDQHVRQPSMTLNWSPCRHVEGRESFAEQGVRDFGRRNKKEGEQEGRNVSQACAKRTRLIDKSEDAVKDDEAACTLATIQHGGKAQLEAADSGGASNCKEVSQAGAGALSHSGAPSKGLDTDETRQHSRTWKPVQLIPDERPLHIIYEDDHILVLNKPANLLTHPPELNLTNIRHYNEAGSVVQRLLHYFRSRNGSIPETFSTQRLPPVAKALLSESLAPAPSACAQCDYAESDHESSVIAKSVAGDAGITSDGDSLFESLIRLPPAISRPAGILHRLDFGTTGALAVAKTFTAAAALREQWKRKEVYKGYVGVCFPELRARQKIDASITRHPVDRARMQALHPQDCGPSTTKKATTIISPLGGNTVWGLVAAVALTGRTHQIRVHLEYIGHPLVGDSVYGQLPKRRIKRCVLEGRERHAAISCPTGHQEMEDDEALAAASQERTLCETCGARKSRRLTYIAGQHVDGKPVRHGVDAAEFEQRLGTAQRALLPGRPLLHAYLLRVRHPVTGRYCEFRAPVPDDIERVADHLNADWRGQLDRVLEDEGAMT